MTHLSSSILSSFAPLPYLSSKYSTLVWYHTIAFFSLLHIHLYFFFSFLHSYDTRMIIGYWRLSTNQIACWKGGEKKRKKRKRVPSIWLHCMMQSDSMHPEVVVPWMPRLQYRAKLGNDPDPVVNVDAISPVSSSLSSSLASTAPSTPALSERSPSPNSSLPAYRKYRQKLMASSSSTSSSYHLSHVNNNAAERKPPQKRASSFFKLFSVKEPSQQALEDYQRQLGISGGASSKDRRLDTVGLTGISSAKLPPTVPKINSKWDGVPHQLIKEKEKEKEKHKQKQNQKRNAHLQFSGYSRSLRSSGSEISGSTNTSSPALSRSSSQYQAPSPSLADGRLQSHNSASSTASSTLSNLYGWESGSGSIISVSGSGTGGGDGNSSEGSKKIKYRSKQKQPRKNASYLQAPPPPFPQTKYDHYLEQDLSDLGALLGPPTAQSSSPHPDLDRPSGCPPNPVTQSSTTPFPDEPLDLSLSDKQASITRNRTSPLALANAFPSSSSSSSSNNMTIIPKTRTTPSPPAAPEKYGMMIHPTIIDQAIAPWVHPRYNAPPAAPVHKNQMKKSVRGIFSGKWEKSDSHRGGFV